MKHIRQRSPYEDSWAPSGNNYFRSAPAFGQSPRPDRTIRFDCFRAGPCHSGAASDDRSDVCLPLILSLTVSQETILAAGTSRELPRKGAGELDAQCGDRVGSVAFGVDWGFRGVGSEGASRSGWPGGSDKGGGNPAPLGNQESVGCDGQRGVMMESAPATAFVMPKPDRLFKFLIVPLNAPAAWLGRQVVTGPHQVVGWNVSLELVAAPAEHGRRSWSGLRSRPCGECRHEHLRGGRLVADRGVRPDGVVVPSPALDDDLGLAQRVKDLSVEQFVAQACIEAPDEPVLPGLPGAM